MSNFILLPIDHELSQKFQNCSFKVLERFNWESPNGLIPCLSIQSSIASKYASAAMGEDSEANYIVKSEDFSVALPVC
jgi:hypothetical protein